MDEDQILGVEKREDFGYLLIRRLDDALHWHVDVIHACRPHSLGFLSCGVLILPAQIDNGFHS